MMGKFNVGEHKLVVCTSVAEEGLDFQACNVVIRYDYVTSMISMIQTRGSWLSHLFSFTASWCCVRITFYKWKYGAELVSLKKVVFYSHDYCDPTDDEHFHSIIFISL